MFLVSSLLAKNYSITQENLKSLDDLFVTIFDYIAPIVVRMLHTNGINEMIQHCREFGLLYRWEWVAFNMVLNIFDIMEYLDKDKKAEINTQLSLDHLRGLFILLFLGLSLATIAFIFELLFSLGSRLQIEYPVNGLMRFHLDFRQ